MTGQITFSLKRNHKLSAAKTKTMTAFKLQATVRIQLVATNRLIFD
jgi:hypothetical protein